MSQKHALILIADGTEEIEAMTPGDILRRCGIEVTYAGLGTTSPTGAQGLPLRADKTIDDVAGTVADMLVIPGGTEGARSLGESPAVAELIRGHADAGKWVAAICAAPALVLAKNGFADGRRVTGYPGTEGMFPESASYTGDAVVIHGKFITSKGPGTAMRFGLTLGELLAGESVAESVAGDLLLAEAAL
ncbi:MAG: DJ-1 family glyoxalase III [Planctomycetota bacterium]